MASLQGILLGIGNPLLDISAEVKTDLLQKYELKAGNAILAEEKHLPLYKELVDNYKVEYIAGGAAQNTIRSAQWMLQSPGATGYIGCIGNDENGKVIKAAAEKDGVTTHYLVDDKAPTGTCAVLVIDKERSLVANLGAANNYKIAHFESAAIQEIVEKAKYYYCTGFFLTVSPDTLISMGKHALKTNKYFLMNLSAPFLIQFFWDQMASVLPYADIIFCNESEAAALGAKQNWGDNLEEVALKLAEFPKENKTRTRMVIFTQGANQTIVCKDGKITKFTPIKCAPEEIVDVNGAGDSFVGGFISQFVQEKSIDQAVAAGHYAAWECIRRPGCTFPPKPTFQ